MLIVNCPKCNEHIIIMELNCAIFRHGAFKNNLNQIPPHSSKIDIELMIKNNLIFGCGSPFKIVDNKAVICDYI